MNYNSIPTLDEINADFYFECPYDHHCDGCEYDCDDGDDL